MRSRRLPLLLALTASQILSPCLRRRGAASAAAATMASAAPNGVGGHDGAPTATRDTPPPHPPAYEHLGPCGGAPTVLRGSLTTSNTGDRLATTLTLPGAAAPGRGPPWPVVAFFNGFQARASFYRQYATHLSSYGFAVLQYDARPLAMPPDALELPWLGDAVAWATGVAPPGALNASALFTAGHSRGGKLAALHAAGAAPGAVDAYAASLAAAEAAEGGEVGGVAPARHAVGRRVGGAADAAGRPAPPPPPPPPPLPAISGAFLIDAVDNTRFAPESPAYPSAARALARAGTPVGLAAAGVVGACNPAEAGTLRALWPAAGAGSWLAVLPDAGHAEFLDAGPLLNRVFDALCRRGGGGGGGAGHGRRATMARTGAAMVAWLDGAARGGGAAAPAGAGAGAAAAAAAGAGRARPVALSLTPRRDGGVRVVLAPSPPPPPPPPPPPAVAGTRGTVRRLVSDFLAWAAAEAAARPGAWRFEVKPGGTGGAGGGGTGASGSAAGDAAAAGNVLPFAKRGAGGGVGGAVAAAAAAAAAAAEA